MATPLRVVVVKGGRSSEREVSLRSGDAVDRGLRAKGHHVTTIDVQDPLIPELDRQALDVVFNALHGPYGEDGGVQALLEAKGIPYTGSGVEASRLAMDKLASKDVFVSQGIPTPPYVAADSRVQVGMYHAWIRKLGYPVVVKPSSQGSSVGTTIVRRARGLESALALAYQYDPVALAEKYIRGRELTVGILDDEPLPIVEIKPGREFYDYEAKYKASDTEYVLEPDLGSDLTMDVKVAALNAYWALGCEIFARVDIILGHDGVPYVLEINTIPGFTERSLLPKAAAHAGISFPDLCDRITRLALSRSSLKVAAARVA